MAHGEMVMMTATQCRMQAADASVRAAALECGALRSQYEALSLDWKALAATVALEESIEAALPECRSPIFAH
jgi:hypothetical protein